MKIHEQLKAVRKYRGLSGLELARLSGIKNSYISQIEHGCNSPTADTIERLAEALNCDVRILPRSL